MSDCEVDEDSHVQCRINDCCNYTLNTGYGEPEYECIACNSSICESCYENAFSCEICNFIMCDNENCNVVESNKQGVCERCRFYLREIYKNDNYCFIIDDTLSFEYDACD